MQVQRVQNNNTTFNARIKGTDFAKKELLSDILKKAPFDTCKESFAVSKSNHNYNSMTDKSEYKAYIALTQKEQGVKGIPIAVPDKESRDTSIIESIIKYLSECKNGIYTEKLNEVSKMLGVRQPNEITPTMTRIEQYSKNNPQYVNKVKGVK